MDSAMFDLVRKHQQPFYKTSVRGSRYSLIDNDGVISFHAVVAPTEDRDLRKAALSAIHEVDTLLKREKLQGCVIAQTVFLRSLTDRHVIEPLLEEYFGDYLPVITYVPQCPCEKSEPFVFEISAVKGETRRIRVIRRGPHAVIYDVGELSYGYFGGFSPAQESNTAYKESMDTFRKMCVEMRRCGFDTSDLLRTWLYQGSITRPEGATQRYKELNRARTDFFNGVQFLRKFVPEGKKGVVYPASTGIGADGIGIWMASIAVRTDAEKSPGLALVPLENPGQTSAFDYGEAYSPQSPKFSRAMALVHGENCRIYVSGTASINDSETQFVGDPAAQTRRTIHNIVDLISGPNLERHGLSGFDATLDDLASARVYIKREADYPLVRSIVDEALRSTPIVYTFTDICRDDLLVEIEGIAVCDNGK
jgi:enamine deaminase RidA (YjgF/YER057c/UK114 family)